MSKMFNNNSQPERRSIKPLEDLIVAIFFAQSEIIKTPNGRELKFNLAKRKHELFNSYIQRNGLVNHIKFNPEKLEGRIKQSILLEKMLRDWTIDGEVHAVDPRYVKTSMFLLWICLFARKTKASVAIDTNLPELTREDIPYHFSNYFDTKMYSKGSSFYIKPFHSVVTRSIQTQILAIENVELNYLLPENEELSFKKKMAEWEECNTNGY
ncbi:hypothetical protein [Sporosarcina sp. FSL K6-1508]|uniref:hypothetical protein n=1 Tax=Sporosarcina sp. FSL K6-1508 TaxID=2921553 RepID=UPI0030F650C7